MLGKVKRVFFISMFTVLYLSFIAQLVYVLGWISIEEGKFVALAALSLEWFLLIASRYLSKRSASAAQYNNFNGRRR